MASPSQQHLYVIFTFESARARIVIDRVLILLSSGLGNHGRRDDAYDHNYLPDSRLCDAKVECLYRRRLAFGRGSNFSPAFTSA